MDVPMATVTIDGRPSCEVAQTCVSTTALVVFIGTGVVAARWSIAQTLQTFPKLLQLFLALEEGLCDQHAVSEQEEKEEEPVDDQKEASCPPAFLAAGLCDQHAVSEQGEKEEVLVDDQKGLCDQHAVSEQGEKEEVLVDDQKDDLGELQGCEEEQEKLSGELNDLEERSLCGMMKMIPFGQDHPARTTAWPSLGSCFSSYSQDDFVIAREGPTLAQMFCFLARLALGMGVEDALPQKAPGQLALRLIQWPFRELPTVLLQALYGCCGWTEHEREGSSSRLAQKGKPENWVIPLSSREGLQKKDGKLYLLIARSNLLNKVLKYLLMYLPQVALVATGIASGSSSIQMVGIIFGVLPILSALHMCLYKLRQRCRRGQSQDQSQTQGVAAAATDAAADPEQQLARGCSNSSRLSKGTVDYVWDCLPVRAGDRLLKCCRRGLLKFLVDSAAPIAMIWQNRENLGLVLTSASGLLAIILANIREHGPELALHIDAAGCGCLGMVFRHLLQPPQKLSGGALTATRLSGAVTSIIMLRMFPGGNAAATAAVELVRLSMALAEEGHRMNLRARESTSPSVEMSVGSEEGKNELLSEIGEKGWILEEGSFLNWLCGGKGDQPVRQVAHGRSMFEVLAEVLLFRLAEQEQKETHHGGHEGPYTRTVIFQERNTGRGPDPDTTTRKLLEQTVKTIKEKLYQVDGMSSVNWRHEIAIFEGYTMADVDAKMGLKGTEGLKKQVVVSEGESGQRLTPLKVKRLNRAMNWIVRAHVRKWKSGKAPHLHVAEAPGEVPPSLLPSSQSPEKVPPGTTDEDGTNPNVDNKSSWSSHSLEKVLPETTDEDSANPKVDNKSPSSSRSLEKVPPETTGKNTPTPASPTRVPLQFQATPGASSPRDDRQKRADPNVNNQSPFTIPAKGPDPSTRSWWASSWGTACCDIQKADSSTWRHRLSQPVDV